jgi:hypothetical protein
MILQIRIISTILPLVVSMSTKLIGNDGATHLQVYNGGIEL